MLRKLELATIHHLGIGETEALFNQALARAIADCEDRPADERSRTVALRVIIKPVLQPGTMTLDDLSIGFDVVDKVPPRRTRDYSMGVKHMGGELGVVFNDGSPGDVNQMTLDEQEQVEEADDD